MNFKANESEQKLNGSYYTPRWLAQFMTKWVMKSQPLSILETSCGDGIFIDSLSSYSYKGNFTGFDIDPYASAIADDKLRTYKIKGHIYAADYLKWAIGNFSSRKEFDAVLGNPPFIRYQYMDRTMQENAQNIFSCMNLKFTKHTNAWVPFVLTAIEFTKPGGRIALVIPSEIINVIYASSLRKYLLKACSSIVLLDPMDIWFEDTLQGAMVLFCEKKRSITEKARLKIVSTSGRSFAEKDPDEFTANATEMNSELIGRKWTFALLNNKEQSLIASIINKENVLRFKDIADVDVGIVTGANKYFLINEETKKHYGLDKLCVPMFGRSEHCPGIIYDATQHEENKAKGLPVNFVDFRGMSDENEYSEYINIGLAENLEKRYKCRIRSPWYIVPSVYASPISLLKRSNGYPRLIYNELGTYTTDTAYRVKQHDGIDPKRLVYSFLNSITALSAELEGRAYGGGVLELVPSEIENLIVPYYTKGDYDLRSLNNKVKEFPINEVVKEQDSMILPSFGLSDNDINVIQSALQRISSRRMKIMSEE